MRSGTVIWGTILLIFGILLLLNNLGIISANVWGIFGALLLIIFGFWMLFGRVLFRGEFKEEPVNIPLDSASEAEITLSHGAGRLFIQSNPGSSDLVSGTVKGGVDVDVDRDNSSVVKVHLETPHNWFLGIPPSGWEHSRDWRLDLTDRVPIKLKVRTGASQSEINLESLQVTELKISTGASQTDVTLPAHAGFTEVKLESGAADTKIKVPDGVSARIRFSGGLANLDVDQTRFPGGHNAYESPDYNSAANRADIKIETGVGSVSIL
jgi:hypothetical protein